MQNYNLKRLFTPPMLKLAQKLWRCCASKKTASLGSFCDYSSFYRALIILSLLLTNLHPYQLDSRTLDVAMSLERSGSTIEHNATRRCEWRVYRSSGLRPWSHDTSLSLPSQQTIPTLLLLLLLLLLPPYCVVCDALKFTAFLTIDINLGKSFNRAFVNRLCFRRLNGKLHLFCPSIWLVLSTVLKQFFSDAYLYL